jgi:hypothetical protein
MNKALALALICVILGIAVPSTATGKSVVQKTDTIEQENADSTSDQQVRDRIASAFRNGDLVGVTLKKKSAGSVGGKPAKKREVIRGKVESIKAGAFVLKQMTVLFGADDTMNLKYSDVVKVEKKSWFLYRSVQVLATSGFVVGCAAVIVLVMPLCILVGLAGHPCSDC